MKKHKNQKSNRKKKLKNENVWYVFLVYVVVPIVVTMLLGLIRKPLIKYMSSLKGGNMEIYNSADILNRIYAPFISSVLFLLGLICTFIIIKCVNKIMDKNGKKFNVPVAKKIVFMVSAVAAVMAVVTLIYSKANTFKCFEYGIASKDIEESLQYIPLKSIPSIQGGNLRSTDDPLLYKFIYHCSNEMEKVEENLGFWCTTISAVLIPLKQKLRTYSID